MQEWEKRKGFTIVELLIVVVVIAILAAITIVAYNGIQNRANDTAVKSDLSSAAKKLEIFKVDFGRYPSSVSEMPAGMTISKSSYDLTGNNVYYCNDRANHTYALGFRSKSGNGFIRTSSGLTEGVAVSQATTCSSIGKSWTNDTTTATFQGYGGGVWSTVWNWVL